MLDDQEPLRCHPGPKVRRPINVIESQVKGKVTGEGTPAPPTSNRRSPSHGDRIRRLNHSSSIEFSRCPDAFQVWREPAGESGQRRRGHSMTLRKMPYPAMGILERAENMDLNSLPIMLNLRQNRVDLLGGLSFEMSNIQNSVSSGESISNGGSPTWLADCIVPDGAHKEPIARSSFHS